MAALSATRSTLKRAVLWQTDVETGQKSGTTIWQGAMVVLNAGMLAPATTATGLVVVGRAQYTSVNAGADGSVSAKAETGIFKWGNSSAGDAITAADRGKDCYIVDDQTVAKTDGTGTRSRAGEIFEVDTDGVWVVQDYGR
jgi:hypothetical protein